MHLHSYRLRNYRRLRDVLVELAPDISIFVGANNSGKTSGAQGLHVLVSGAKDRLSLFDFSAPLWRTLDEIGDLPPNDDDEPDLPRITADLWFQVAANDLYLAMPLLPSTRWQGTHVGIRVSFEARQPLELVRRFRELRERATADAGGTGSSENNYQPWPSSLSEYLSKELAAEYELKYYVLDEQQFDSGFVEKGGYEPAPMTGEPGGAALLKSLMRVDFLSAQRHLSDPLVGNGTAGRAEDLSRKLSRFYDRNLAKRADDHGVLRALFESEQGLNAHLSQVFSETLDRLATLGYPGVANPRMVIRSALNPATVLSQDARVHYVVGSGDSEVRLPDSYNGLGFKNLIYMVVELLDLQERWKDEEEKRAPLHLVFIEEPEAHLHAQLQQVFIRNVLELLKVEGEEDGSFISQLVVTTHSPHILYERGFPPIRYFRRHHAEDEHSTDVVNLSSFQADGRGKDRDFLQRYLRLTHCDLFFADAAILVEGNVERLLLPAMINTCARDLRSASLSILEVGGAFAHRFKALIEFIGITTLVITDLDSVELVVPSDAAGGSTAGDGEDADEPKVFEVPDEGSQGETKVRTGKTCIASHPGALTANQTLIQWIPGKQTVADLLAITAENKIQTLAGSDSASVRVAYQVPTSVTVNGVSAMVCGRTLEEAFGLENADWCQEAEHRTVGLRLRTAPVSPEDLAQRLHKRVTGPHFDKTKFALEVLASEPESSWKVPLYIREGLQWLEEQVSKEVREDAGVVAASTDTGALTGVNVAVAVREEQQ